MKLTRRLKSLSLPLSAVLGVGIALCIVIAWFPNASGAWNEPLQQIDAPAHYYFIRKILKFGPAAALHLWPNDAYYPPMFHLAAAGLIELGNLFGAHISIYAAFNVVWLFTSGVLWPVGMSLLASYWTRKVDGQARDWRPFSCVMMLAVPVLAVSSASHPFYMLAQGPLISYGLATTLLPFWLYVSLRCFDAIAERRNRVRWIAAVVALGALDIFAHPRIAFTWLLLMAPYILLRLPWKLIAGAVAAVAVLAVAFYGYMTSHYTSTRYLDPSSWFHTYTPSRSLGEALKVFVSDNIPGFAGGAMAVAVVVALAVVLMLVVRPQVMVRPTSASGASTSASSASTVRVRKDALAMLMDVALVCLVYVCSAALTGWFPNIVAAAWYRAETRPLTMLPIALVPLLVFAVSALAKLDWERFVPAVRGVRTRERSWGMTIPAVLLVALTLVVQFGNVTRTQLSESVGYNMQLDRKAPDDQLTSAKVKVLRQTVDIAGTDALIISDPMNGSMYAQAMYGANMLYPIYNAMHEQNGAVFGRVEDAFGSGKGAEALGAVCPVGLDGSGSRTDLGKSAHGPVYFLSMGPQAPSLGLFTFKQQYDVFHDQRLIDRYVEDGTLVKVKDFGNVAPESEGWALYRFTCGN